MRIDLWQSSREKAVTLPCGLKVLKEDKQRMASGDTVFCLTLWLPKATKPFLNVYYRTQELRDGRIDEAVKGLQYRQEQKEKRKAERRGDPAQWELVQVGFIFHCSWGYDQTNNDFYQVIAKKGQFVTLRAIGQKSIASPVFSPMSDHRTAVKDAFLENSKPFVKKVQFSSGRPYITMNSYSSAHLWDGEKVYNSWYA